MFFSQKRFVLFAILMFIFTTSGCGYGGENDNTNKQPDKQTTSVLSQNVRAALQETLFDEYKARATYEKVIETFGSVRPFSNIAKAEVKHANAILELYKKYGIAAPQDPWNTSKIKAFSSVSKACEGGVQAEIENAAIYDRLLKQDLPQDIKEVFIKLRDASEDNHLQAFKRCSSR